MRQLACMPPATKDTAATVSPARPPTYDRVTIALHWTTALLVLVLFGTTLWWTYAPRSINFRFELEDIHVSLGILFAAVVLARIVWRLTGGRRLPPADHGVQQRLAGLVHALLYVLIVAQVGLGFVLRWLQGGELSFFGLFALPALLAKDRPTAELVETLHKWNGWAIVIVAAGHAAAALLHHYWLKDRVLGRMLPAAEQ